MYGGMRYIFGSSSFWLTLLLTSGLLGARIMAYKGWRRYFYPQLRHIVQEVFALGLDQRSIIEYTDLADKARKLGLSMAEMAWAQKTAYSAAEAVVVVPGGSVGSGGSGASSPPASQHLLQSSTANASHFVNTSPVKVDKNGFSDDPSEGAYSVLRGGPSFSSSSSASASTPFSLAAPAATPSTSSSTASPVSRTAQQILDAALKPTVRPGDGDFDTEISPNETGSAPISPENFTSQRGSASFSTTDRVAAVLNADFKATVQAKLNSLERKP